MMRNQLVETEETDSYIGIAGGLDAVTVAKSSKGKAAKRNTAASGIAAAGAKGIATVKQRVRGSRGEAEKYIGVKMR